MSKFNQFILESKLTSVETLKKFNVPENRASRCTDNLKTQSLWLRLVLVLRYERHDEAE